MVSGLMNLLLIPTVHNSNDVADGCSLLYHYDLVGLCEHLFIKDLSNCLVAHATLSFPIDMVVFA